MPLLFSYGTLQQEDVQVSTFGRRFHGWTDELVGFAPALVEIEDPQIAASLGRSHHQNVEFVGDERRRVSGTAFEITDTELLQADHYELAFSYRRIEAILGSGRRAWVYVHANTGGTMSLQFDEALPVLRRTPTVLRSLLLDLPEPWITAVEGPGTWSPFDVVGHLIHGERTDWIPRVEHILRHGEAVPFPPFDREAMFAASKGRTLAELLDTFEQARTDSLERLAAMRLTEADLARRGRHPEFGAVTMGQHLATWVAHDLSHLGQVVRVMARRYSDAVGPWKAYLSILNRPA